LLAESRAGVLPQEMIFKSWKKAPENPDNMFM
jgi:hypothetical protein